MSKMAEMDQTIKELRDAAAAINAAADWLTQQFAGNDKQPNSDNAANQKKKPEISLADVRAVLADKSRAGYTAEVRDLLKKYGAEKLSKVNPADYEALMNDAEVLGNGS